MDDKKKLLVTLYLVAGKLRMILYISASLIVLIPIIIIMGTDAGFSEFYGKLFINTSLVFVIMGRVLKIFENTIEHNVNYWLSILSILLHLMILFYLIKSVVY